MLKLKKSKLVIKDNMKFEKGKLTIEDKSKYKLLHTHFIDRHNRLLVFEKYKLNIIPPFEDIDKMVKLRTHIDRIYDEYINGYCDSMEEQFPFDIGIKTDNLLILLATPDDYNVSYVFNSIWNLLNKEQTINTLESIRVMNALERSI